MVRSEQYGGEDVVILRNGGAGRSKFLDPSGGPKRTPSFSCLHSHIVGVICSTRTWGHICPSSVNAWSQLFLDNEKILWKIECMSWDGRNHCFARAYRYNESNFAMSTFIHWAEGSIAEFQNNCIRPLQGCPPLVFPTLKDSRPLALALLSTWYFLAILAGVGKLQSQAQN
jgi:hypothetical protein